MEAADPAAPVFGGLALGAAFCVLVGILALMAGVMGAKPGLIQMISKYPMLYILGGGIVVSIIFAIGGMIVGRTAR
jgi:hypothetical protein